jgi:hypothetical protein
MVGGAAERGAIEGDTGHRCKCSRLWRLHWLSCQGDRETGACSLHVHTGTGGKGQGGLDILSPIPLYLYLRA